MVRGVLLLSVGPFAAASDPPPSLLGEWTLAGEIDLVTKAVTPAHEEYRVELRRDIVVTTSRGSHQAMYCSWTVDAQGIELLMEQGNGSVVHAPMRIMADGIVMAYQGFRVGLLLKRVDGRPPGLPPSAWPESAAAPSTTLADGGALAAGDFSARVQSLHLTRSLTYPDSATGKVSGFDHVSFGIALRAKVVATIVAVRRSTIDEAITDDGEDLRLGPGQDPFADPQFAAGQVFDSGDIRIDVPLRWPTSGARELARFRGTVLVRYESRTRTPFDLPLPRSLIGTRQLIADTGLGLTITSISADTVTWTADEGLAALVKEYQFFDAAGRKLADPACGSTHDGQKKTVEQRFTVQLPDQGAIRVRLYGTTDEVAVPILLEHVALTPPPPAVPPRKF